MESTVDKAVERLASLKGDVFEFTSDKTVAEEVKREQVDSLKAAILNDMPQNVKTLDSLRKASKSTAGKDITMGEFMRAKYGFAHNEDGSMGRDFLSFLGVDSQQHSIAHLQTMSMFPDGYNWIIPEIFRDAIRTGLRRAPIYPSLIAAEQSVSQQLYFMPSVNMSEAMPKRLNEAESIPVGELSFSQKSVKIRKVGLGLSISDEVISFSNLDVLSVFLQDLGVKMATAQDTDAINTLISGDQVDGSDAITTVGVAASGTLAYRDMLKAWVRMSRIGRTPSGIITGEDLAIDTLMLPEFKGFAGGTTLGNFNMKTPIPKSQDLMIHGSITDPDAMLFIDKSSALIKLNLNALTVDSERIASKQIQKSYVSMFTGYATLFRDARLLMLRDSTAGFNGIFDVNTIEQEIYK
jgi:HK97 family phage major capsid protein